MLAAAVRAFPKPGDTAAGPIPASPAPITYRSGIITSGRGTWFSRLRVPMTFALLSIGGHKRMKMEAFEKAPLLRGEIEATPVSETSHLSVERLRFWSGTMQQPRFLLSLSVRLRRSSASIRCA